MTDLLADIENICFVDTETRAEDGSSVSDGDVSSAGTYRYAQRSFVIISTFGIGNRPVFDVSLNDGFAGDWLCWDEVPYELREFHKRVEQREAWYAAWNAAFDREAWNAGTADWPILDVDNVVDIMAQAVASNLPPKLEGASRAIGRHGKQDDGKALIELFCRAGGATPQSEPDKWDRFRSYGRQDTDELREVYRHTRALPFEEWEDYWVSERINRRGVAIDLPFVERAAKVAAADVKRANEQLVRWTNGQITAVTQAARIAQWAYDAMEENEARNLLVSEWDEDSEDDLKVGKLSLKRERIAAVLAFYATKGDLSPREQAIVDVLSVRRFGGSSSPKKFEKMLAQHDDGRLKGQYVLNGAAQTGRFSSRGVQTHNLVRSSLGAHEATAIEMINDL